MERKDRTADAIELMNHHRRLTSSLASRIGRSDAEDVASEALARSLRRPPPDGAHQPWVERIVRNLVVDRARRAHRTAAHAPDLSRTADAAAPADPEQQLLLAERRRALQAALPAVPAGLRDALVGRFYEDQDYETVAATRGITPTTARTRVHRALACLRSSLARLRATVPLPALFGGHTLSATSALVPAALGAVLVVTPLAMPLGSGGMAPVLSGHESVEPAVGPRPPRAGIVATASGAGAGFAASAAGEPGREATPSPLPRGTASSPGSTTSTTSITPTPAAVRDAAPSSQRPPAPRAAASESAASDATSPPAVQRLRYDDDIVEGELQRPDSGEVWGTPPRVKQPSLIEIRRELTREIAKMVEEL